MQTIKPISLAMAVLVLSFFLVQVDPVVHAAEPLATGLSSSRPDIGTNLTPTPLVTGLVQDPDPTVTTPTPTAVVTEMRLASATRVTNATPIMSGGKVFGIPGEIQCWDCNPFTAKVHLSHYIPNEGPINCYDWDPKKKYCMSDMKSGLPWESFYGFAAACPFEWPYGTWLDIPDVGQFICLDRGGMITCQDGVCNVDLLGPGGPKDGQVLEITLWVPLRPR